jgi:ferredoxin-NADP reductase
MNRHIVKVLKSDFVTHNVKRFVVEKPEGYSFVAGQATDIAINRPSLENELRPFTFTCLNEAGHLEFIIKIYKGHNGMTEKLDEVNAGDELILHEVFGTISYKGPGLFIAGGAGITPFIAILRQLQLRNELSGITLLFANRTADDIILHDELKDILQDKFINVLEITDDPGMKKGFINSELLKQYLRGGDQYCYVCGPDKFTAIMVEKLLELGVPKSQIIIEQ